MNLFLRQVWALIRKNLLLICMRRPIGLFLRALALPVVIVFVVAYSKEFFSSPQHWGVSSPHNIRSLKDGMASITTGHNIVGFVDNGMKGGEVSAIIETLSQQVRENGRIAKSYTDSAALALECRTDSKGISPCYGAVQFYSSPTEGTNISRAGTWNYTLRGEGGSWGNGFADIRNDNNFAERTLLPFQQALDAEIVRSVSTNVTQLPSPAEIILFTPMGQEELDDSRTSNYLTLAIYAFGPIFVFTLVDVIYHMTSFIARERELGMSGLIDTMLPGGSNTRGRLVRQISIYGSSALIYAPSWIIVGSVISAVVYPVHSRGLPTGFLILSGLAFTSFSLFGASFFRKAQLSGSIMAVITIVGAILPVVLIERTKTVCALLSIIFPSANLSYFLTGVGIFEVANRPVNMSNPSAASDDPKAHTFRLPLNAHWAIAVVQILIFPVLAFYTEHLRFSTSSPHRRTATPEPGEPTVVLTGFTKTYRAGFLSKLLKRRKDVHAVTGLDLKAYPGQILCLLGPNGCGKSTTLNCISGDQKVTSGDIVIDQAGGLGYAPQKNVIWPELTVEEHLRIFSDLKCLTDVNDEVVAELAKSVDLLMKLKAPAKSLSGGQKRKLQMAMMFAGGSAVCCVDEVSTGLDPISRRRIWEILLAERKRRTIIMTTHFLDEADYLADDVAIMYKGTLRAAGTSASLKHTYGDGYTVTVPNSSNLNIQLPEGTSQAEHSRHQTTHRVATAALATQMVESLASAGIHDHQVSGPTMEELFLKVTGDKIVPLEERADEDLTTEEAKLENVQIHIVESGYELSEGRPISMLKQWWILLFKRFRILRRRFIPYLVAVTFAIVGAGVAPLLIKKFTKPITCPTPSSLVYDYDYRSDFGTGYEQSYRSSYGGDDTEDWYGKKYVFGPSSKVDEYMARFSIMADTYSINNTYAYSPEYPRGYTNASQIIDQMILVDTYDEFKDAVYQNWNNLSRHYGLDSTPYANINGGIWLDESKPTILGDVTNLKSMSQMMNLFNVMRSGVPISADYNQFASTEIPELIDFVPLMFIIYYGLIMCCYPMFFALYPTNERISNVRSMQYSNGIRPVPLWLSHLVFDSIFVLVISVVAVGLLSISTPVWHGLGIIFVIFVLYGIVSALLAYIISMFAKTAVTAWLLCCLGQVILYFAYFGGIIGVQSSVPYAEMESMMNALFFGLGLISPAVCLERALFIGLQQMALQCNGHPDGSLYLFGGPILYLILQGIFLFGLLLWWDSGFVLPYFRSHRVPPQDSEANDMYSSDLLQERKRLADPSTALQIHSVSKSFGKNLAVDNVTFGVQDSEIFALLGPNGAGKSTLISMIRGDLKPSTSISDIAIASHSIRTNAVSARANLGVCPQFDSADVLTVRETLRFFARTRGVIDIEHNVSTVIAACGLTDYTAALAQTLSGGTKRKLSLAVALVGNPRVLVLDEPSSALDASAKRTLWKCLQTVSKDRAVVLTTHSMEEADALADRIGIVSSRMLALGSRDELKKRAGANFHVHVVLRSAPRSSAQDIERVKEWVASMWADARVSRETQGGQVRFEVPVGEKEGREMVEIMKKMEAVKEELGVEYYSVGKATLDEVFENIVKRYGDGDGGNAEL